MSGEFYITGLLSTFQFMNLSGTNCIVIHNRSNSGNSTAENNIKKYLPALLVIHVIPICVD